MHQTDDGDDNGVEQTKLDGFVQRMPKWTRDALKEYIMNWVIATDQVCRFMLCKCMSISLTPNQAFEGVDHPTFRAMLRYQRPSMLELDIPHQTLVSEDVMHKADLVQFCIGQHFKVSWIPSKSSDNANVLFENIASEVLLTFDLWTSRSYDPYLGITAHYIDTPADRHSEWELKTVTLGYTVVEGNHSGANIAAHIIQVLDKYGLREKVDIYVILGATMLIYTSEH